MIIKDALNAYALSVNKTWLHDRSQTVGASEVGMCSRKVFWLKNEGDHVHAVKRDPEYIDTWGARVRGTVFETHFWEPALRSKFGARLLFAGADQKTFALGFLSATPDGMIVGLTAEEKSAIGIGANCVLVEAKTIDPRARLDGPKPEHAYQVQVQLGLVRELTEYQPTHAIISYCDSSFWNEVAEHVVTFDPAIYATAKKRAAAIMTALAFDELRPEGWIAGGKECGYCPFTRACGRERSAVPSRQQSSEPPDPQFVAEIADLAREAKRLDSAADATTAELREIQHDIRERLRTKGLRKVAGNGVTVTWSPVKGRPAFNMPAIREAAAKAGIDLAQHETVGDPTDRLVITTTPPSAA
jgi:hypothetical protein